MRAVLAALSITCAIGCRETELTKLEGIRAEVCACKTVACADAAMAKLPDVVATKRTPTRSFKSQVKAKAMVDCLAKLYERERPEAGPDVEQP